MENAQYCIDRNEWRRWLESNSDKESHIWLGFYKKNAQKEGISLEEAVEEAICFGWIDGKLKRVDSEKYIVRFSLRKANSVWSKINRDRAKRMIALGRMTDAGLAKIEAAKKSGWWDMAYTNKVADKIPVDLQMELKVEKGAWENFQRFANSYRNIYVGWVNDAKTEKTRKTRIRKVVEQSIKNKKSLF